jgi:hypothetical protein
MSAVVYIRAPDSLKQALKTYAVEGGMTETAAAVSLLERALEAIEHEASVAQLKRKLEAATRELETTRAALHEAELQQRAAAHVYKAVARRAHQPLAKCKACQAPLSGADLFAAGICPNCSVGITDLVVWTKGGLNQTEYLPFIGLLGALVGLALDTPSNTPPE